MHLDRLQNAKRNLIEARREIEAHRPAHALLCMKWAMEHILPEGQQYCSQTLDDSDPEKTLQGLLDNIVTTLRNTRL